MLCWNRCAGSPPRWWDDTVPFAEIPPLCPHCGGLLRPGVVWFGESIDPDVSRQSFQALQCDIFLTVGTSAVVYPAASLTFEAKERGAFTVEINPEPTPASGAVDLVLQRPAEHVLAALQRILQAPEE